MRAVRISDYNATPTIDEVDKPVPGAGEVLIRVKAAALNPLDVKLLRGYVKQVFPLKFPYTMGTDLSGEIEQIGAGVTEFAIGDAVVARTETTAGGALAEYVVVAARLLVKAPAIVALEDAAGIPTAAGTVWQAFNEDFPLEPSHSVLIHGGLGGVGSFAVQFAHRSGARVPTTVSTGSIDTALSLGADVAVDYTVIDFAEHLSDLDVVLDTVGGEIEHRSYKVLRHGGRLIATPVPPDEARAAAHDVKASFVFHSSDGQRLQRVVQAIDQDNVRVLVDRKVPLEDFADALAHQASGRAHGKIILLLN